MTLGGLPKGGHLETITEANTFGQGHMCGYPWTLGWEVPPANLLPEKGCCLFPGEDYVTLLYLETTSILSQIKGLAPQDQAVTYPCTYLCCDHSFCTPSLSSWECQIPYPYPLSLPPLYISPPPSLHSYPKAWTEVSLYFSGGMRVIILKYVI